MLNNIALSDSYRTEERLGLLSQYYTDLILVPRQPLACAPTENSQLVDSHALIEFFAEKQMSVEEFGATFAGVE